MVIYGQGFNGVSYTTTMAEFIIKERLTNAEVNSIEQTLIAPMNDRQITAAETIYGAILKTIIRKN